PSLSGSDPNLAAPGTRPAMTFAGSNSTLSPRIRQASSRPSDSTGVTTADYRPSSPVDGLGSPMTKSATNLSAVVPPPPIPSSMSVPSSGPSGSSSISPGLTSPPPPEPVSNDMNPTSATLPPSVNMGSSPNMGSTPTMTSSGSKGMGGPTSS